MNKIHGILETAREALGFEVVFVSHLQSSATISGLSVRSSSGKFLGTFCRTPDDREKSFSTRDLKILQAFADVTRADLERDANAEQVRLEKQHRIRAMLASSGPQIIYQPVFTLSDMQMAGAEALSRFPEHNSIPPDRWFNDAAEVGLQVEFELQAINNALIGFQGIWDKHNLQLGLNASPATILDDRLEAAFTGYPRDRVVVELTEHQEVTDYASLGHAIARLRDQGIKIAIDDVGSGYASMQHVLALRPEILKLDVCLTRSIDTDGLRLALVSSLKHFADQFACRIVAEGVETAEELAVLRKLELQAAQGYLLGRPAPASTLFDQAATTSKAFAG